MAQHKLVKGLLDLGPNLLERLLVVGEAGLVDLSFEYLMVDLAKVQRHDPVQVPLKALQGKDFRPRHFVVRDPVMPIQLAACLEELLHVLNCDQVIVHFAELGRHQYADEGKHRGLEAQSGQGGLPGTAVQNWEFRMEVVLVFEVAVENVLESQQIVSVGYREMLRFPALLEVLRQGVD